MDWIQADSHSVVRSDPEISGGTPVFRGTRVPVQSLFDYLEGGETLDHSLDQFPVGLEGRGARCAGSGVRLHSGPCAFGFDENLPRALAAELTGHHVSSVQAEGWSATKNGALLRQAGEYFDALLSMDRGLPHQQNLRGFGLRLLIIRAPSNPMVHLRPLVDSPKTLAAMSPGQLPEVGG